MLSVSEVMLKAQAERAKNDITKKLMYNKDGTIKSMIEILKQLRREAVCNADTSNSR